MAKKKGAAELFIAAIGVMVLLALIIIGFLIFPAFFVNLSNSLTGVGVSTGAPTLAISGLPSQLNVSPDSSYTLPVVVSLTNGSSIPLSISAVDLPAWLSVSFSKRAGITPFETNITFAVSPSLYVPPNDAYNFASPGINVFSSVVIFQTNVSASNRMYVNNKLPVIIAQIVGAARPVTFNYYTGFPIMNITETFSNSTWSNTTVVQNYDYGLGYTIISQGNITSVGGARVEFPFIATPTQGDKVFWYMPQYTIHSGGGSPKGYNFTITFTFAGNTKFIYNSRTIVETNY